MEHSTRVVFLTEGAAEKIQRTPGATRCLVARGLIPYRKRAGRLYFYEDELDAWLDKAPGVRIEDLK
jgi:hypothetical protein